MTYRELAERSSSAARRLALDARPGERALLIFPTGTAFWEAFIGCLACGIVAVPLKTQNLLRDDVSLREVCADCMPSIILTDESTADLLRRKVGANPYLDKLHVITPDQWRGDIQPFNQCSPNPDAIAFLQYTSGSTSNPKGVQISQENLIANVEIIQQRMGIRVGNETGVTWLPHYHDMGLVGSYLTTLLTNTTSYCLPPEEFAFRPARWLKLISEHRASISGGPNFAYQHCLEKISADQIDGLDLSSWRVAYVGAERVRSETLRAFQERFSDRGFRFKSFFPCYGLGEATLMVTGGPPERPPTVRKLSSAALMKNRIEPPVSDEDTLQLVGCGQTFVQSHVLIVDRDQMQALADDTIGEICVSGASVTRGYFNRDDLNNKLFLEIEFNGRKQQFLQTGDLGFLSDGELFITGRTKEIIIVRGKNLSPEDIEQRVCVADPSLKPDGAIAFSVEQNGEEVLLVVAELKKGTFEPDLFEPITDSIRATIVAAFGVNPFEIFLVKTNSIPRTSSGKPKRMLVKSEYLEGQLSGIIHRVH